MKLIWSPMAIRNRAAIFDWIAKDNAAAAIRLDERFMRICAAISTHPEMGKPGRITGTREFVAHRSYRVIYRIAGDEVRILRIVHTARLWPDNEGG